MDCGLRILSRDGPDCPYITKSKISQSACRVKSSNCDHRSLRVKYGRLHTEPDTVKNRLFFFLLLSSFSEDNSTLAQLLAFIYT